MRWARSLHPIAFAAAFATACASSAQSTDQTTMQIQTGPPGGFDQPGEGGGDASWSTIAEASLDTERRPVSSRDVSQEGIAPATAETTGFRVAYAPSRNAALDQVRAAFQREQVFESIASELNQLLRIPAAIDIQMVDCGTVNAFYDPDSSRIIVCYEFVAYLARTFATQFSDDDELGTAVVGATLFAFFHELGHALRDKLDLPLTGREEDAVDQLATLILMRGGEDGVGAALSGAYWFALQGSATQTDQIAFWDEHSLDQQRFYNIACLVYGSDTERYAALVNNQLLPSRRAARCPLEHAQARKAWEAILAPHFLAGGSLAAQVKPTEPAAE